uniref:C2H2-type domain-containing protein n=1 Tax=Glossina brevipalpis TaxID=37001 RepID=A0A1A9WIN3_9MUSC
MENCVEIESSIVALHKCGEIFYEILAAQDTQAISVSFQCSFCRKTFIELNIFLKHLQSDHCRPSAPTKEFCSENEKQLEEEYQPEEIFLMANDNDSEIVLEDITRVTEAEGKNIVENMSCDEHKKQKCAKLSQQKQPVKRRATREYICPHCHKIFYKVWSLQQHLNTHDGYEKPYKCELCPAAYASKQNLVVHVRRHNGEKPFGCHFCTRTFTSTSERYIHERCHTGERPYVCEFCGKSHTTSSHLHNHRRLHLDERNFVCGLCDKRFNRRDELRKHHKNLHTEVARSHVCPICKAAFKGKTTLKEHVKIHKEKTYKCPECGKTFAQHSGLYSHRKTHQKLRDTLLKDVMTLTEETTSSIKMTVEILNCDETI